MDKICFLGDWPEAPGGRKMIDWIQSKLVNTGDSPRYSEASQLAVPHRTRAEPGEAAMCVQDVERPAGHMGAAA